MDKLYWIALAINLLFNANYLFQAIITAKDCLSTPELTRNLPYISLPYLLLAIFFGGISAAAFYAKQYSGDIRLAISISFIPFVLISMVAVVVVIATIANVSYK